MTESAMKKANELWITAIHEAGHVLGVRLAGSEIAEATIVPGKNTLGHVRSDLSRWENNIVRSLLGHAAELELGLTNRDFAYSKDYEEAVKDIKDMLRHRKGEEMGLTAYEIILPKYQRQEVRNALRMTKGKWKPILDQYTRKARRLAKKHRAYIKTVAGLLMEKGSLTDAEIPQLEERVNGRGSFITHSQDRCRFPRSAA